MDDPGGPRLLLQYLEPSPAVDAATPGQLRDHLAAALNRLPVTDVALGWRLPLEVIEAVRPVIPAGVMAWRWVPMFVDSGDGRPEDGPLATGTDGRAPPPFGDMADFRFLCLDHDEVVEAGLERAVRLGREVDADGVLLDRIRWHSPSRSPAAEMTCFCARSRAAAGLDELDLDLVAANVRTAERTLDGRRQLVAALLGDIGPDPLGEFMSWRAGTVTRAVRRVAAGLRENGLASALDVFSPTLAPSVGQDLAALADSALWAKSMTYFDALGPAAMPFELRGYAAWLEAAGERDARGFISRLLGFDPPGVGARGPRLPVLRLEAERLSAAMGDERSIIGLDAVEIDGVCEVADEDLDKRITTVRGAGLGLSPSWDALLISDRRLGRIAAAWAGG